MPLDGITPTAVALPALHIALRTFQTGLELVSVHKQTQDVLYTISQVTADLKSATALRRKKSWLLDRSEKDDVDRTIQDTEKALEGLEALVERPRVDMMTKAESIRFSSRVKWVLKDATNVPAAMARLGVAFAALNREITILRGLRDKKLDDNWLNEEEKVPPPAYQDAQKPPYLRRQSTKKQSTLHVNPVEPSSPMTEMDSGVRGISCSEATLSLLSGSGKGSSPLSQSESGFPSLASETHQEALLRTRRPGREVLSTTSEVFVPSISDPSEFAPALESTYSPLPVSEHKSGQQARPGEEPCAVSQRELALMPSTLPGCERGHWANSRYNGNLVATDRGSSRSSSARGLRQSRSRSWLAFQASRPLSPAASPTLRWSGLEIPDWTRQASGR
ncbi:hypothetical protein GJ744_011088 [Endocarpon pusillum]|uniref:Uncharacterized protein n=1 Tax=Endocarpon pusillum TaxID=364733 RepID=A0A8H7AFK6_9EURO|nr:hypothetical protein GJ744_011088 [Endocarpon pusillum]